MEKVEAEADNEAGPESSDLKDEDEGVIGPLIIFFQFYTCRKC